jgi:hypothetical protein
MAHMSDTKQKLKLRNVLEDENMDDVSAKL